MMDNLETFRTLKSDGVTREDILAVIGINNEEYNFYEECLRGEEIEKNKNEIVKSILKTIKNLNSEGLMSSIELLNTAYSSTDPGRIPGAIQSLESCIIDAVVISINDGKKIFPLIQNLKISGLAYKKIENIFDVYHKLTSYVVEYNGENPDIIDLKNHLKNNDLNKIDFVLLNIMNKILCDPTIDEFYFEIFKILSKLTGEIGYMSKILLERTPIQEKEIVNVHCEPKDETKVNVLKDVGIKCRFKYNCETLNCSLNESESIANLFTYLSENFNTDIKQLNNYDKKILRENSSSVNIGEIIIPGVYHCD